MNLLLVAQLFLLVATVPVGAENSADRLMHRAAEFSKSKHYNEALHCLSDAIVISPKSSVLYHKRGELYNKLQDFKSAVADFNQAIALNDKDMEVYFKRGWAYDQLSDFEASVNDYSKFLTYKPKDYFGMCCLADNLCELGQTERAMQVLNELIVLHPTEPQPRRLRGLLLAGKNGNYKKAIEDFSVALKDTKYDHYADLLGARADACIKVKDFPQALSDIQAQLKLIPKDDNARRKLANIYYLSGAYQKACDEYTRVIEMEPMEAGGNYMARARCYEKLGKTELARKDLQKCKELDYSGK